MREPAVQAQQLVRRLVRRAANRLGAPGTAVAAELETVRVPYQAKRLLSLLHVVRSWPELLVVWRAEQTRAEPRAAPVPVA